MSVNLLIVSKGHAFSHDSFLTMFAEMSDVVTTLVEQPAAQVILQPENVASYDAVLFYDMSGIPDAGLCMMARTIPDNRHLSTLMRSRSFLMQVKGWSIEPCDFQLAALAVMARNNAKFSYASSR